MLTFGVLFACFWCCFMLFFGGSFCCFILFLVFVCCFIFTIEIPGLAQAAHRQP